MAAYIFPGTHSALRGYPRGPGLGAAPPSVNLPTVDDAVNPAERIFGIDIARRPGDEGGVALIAKPTTIIAALVGAMLGARLSVGMGKNYVVGGAVGAAAGMLFGSMLRAGGRAGW